MLADHENPDGADWVPAPPIRPLRRAEMLQGAQALMQAFLDYALFQYIFGTAALAPGRLQAFMGGFVRLMMDQGHVYCGPEPEHGVAMFLPPAVLDIPTWKVLLASLRQAPRAGLSHLPRMLAIADEFNAKRPRTLHWYTVLIGVAPQARRQGLGRRLMQHALRQADASMQPMYLETAARDNVDFYAGLGFQLRQQFHCHHGHGPEIWCMYRPAPSSSSEVRP